MITILVVVGVALAANVIWIDLNLWRLWRRK